MKEIVRLKIKFLFYNMAIVTAVIGVTFFAAEGRQERSR